MHQFWQVHFSCNIGSGNQISLIPILTVPLQSEFLYDWYISMVTGANFHLLNNTFFFFSIGKRIWE